MATEHLEVTCRQTAQSYTKCTLETCGMLMQVHVCGDDSAVDLIQRLCDDMGDTLEVGREGGKSQENEASVRHEQQQRHLCW
jgi:hypothetical protein